MREIPLKKKYIIKKPAGNKSKSANNAPKRRIGNQGFGIRRRAYGPFNTF